MAAWIKWNHGLESRPEVLAMARSLGLDPIHVAGCRMVAWAWGDRELRNGRAASVDVAQLDQIARVENFGNAMKRVGWLRCDDDGFVFSKWDRHNSKSAKQRTLDLARKGRNGSGKIPDSNRNNFGKNQEQSKRESKSKSKSKNKNKDSPLPPDFQTPEFQSAWTEWQAFRNEQRKPMTASTIKKQIALFQTIGHDAAIASINQSIRNGWQGLFDPRREDSRRPARKPSTYVPFQREEKP